MHTIPNMMHGIAAMPPISKPISVYAPQRNYQSANPPNSAKIQFGPGYNQIMRTLDLRESFKVLDGLESLKRRVEERLYFNLGEWIYKRDEGVPYDQFIFRERDIGVIQQAIISQIEGVPEVDRAEITKSEFTPSTRKLVLDIRVYSRYDTFTMRFPSDS